MEKNKLKDKSSKFMIIWIVLFAAIISSMVAIRYFGYSRPIPASNEKEKEKYRDLIEQIKNNNN